jgi:hypothetical protein
LQYNVAIKCQNAAIMGVGGGSFLDREKAKFTIIAGCISSSWWNWPGVYKLMKF